jgi:hypothetical protein
LIDLVLDVGIRQLAMAIDAIEELQWQEVQWRNVARENLSCLWSYNSKAHEHFLQIFLLLFWSHHFLIYIQTFVVSLMLGMDQQGINIFIYLKEFGFLFYCNQQLQNMFMGFLMSTHQRLECYNFAMIWV